MTSAAPALVFPIAHVRPAALGDRGGAKIAAEKFESAFLAEMLRHAGFDAAIAGDSGYGGETMASFMVAEIADRLSARQHFGIAEKIDAKISGGR